MTDQPKKESCCEKGGCCCGKKLIVSVLVGLLLLAVGYCLGKNSLCGIKTQPAVQMQK